MKVDQDKLCEFCKSHNDNNMDGCEGSQCAEMQRLYLDDVGITQADGTTFSGLNVGDILYKIKDFKLTVDKVKEIGFKESSCNLLCDEGWTDPYLNKSKYISRTCSYYTNKKEAAEEFKKLITEKMIEMSLNLSKFI